MTLLVAAASAIAVTLALVRLLSASLQARPVAALLLAIAFAVLSSALVTVVASATPRTAVALRRGRHCRLLGRGRPDGHGSGVRRFALQPAEQLADDGGTLGGGARRNGFDWSRGGGSRG